jgi:hypothetical protein
MPILFPPRSRARKAAHQLAGILAFASMWQTAGAEEGDTSMFSFGAFGTLGVVHSSEHLADYTDTIFQANGAGYTRSWSPDVDSRLGAQVAANFLPQLSAVLQVISEQNYDGSYTPHVEWANLKYQPTLDLSVRVGRTVLPSFLVSDSRKVGYANPWIRPPVELYGLVPVSQSDGIDVSYSVHAGDWINTVVGLYGRNNQDSPTGGSADAKHIWNISDTIEHGPATLHFTYQQLHLTVDSLDAFFDAFRQFGLQGIDLAEKYDVDNKLVSFIGIGGLYDAGRWFGEGEWGNADFHSAFGRSTAWYISGGYRLASLTPYLTYALVKADGNTSDPGLSASGLPPALAGAAAGLNAALNSILGAAEAQRTISLGTRWDFYKNVDLKLQIDHTRLAAGSPGSLMNLQPGFQPGGTVNLFSAAIDFVW